jgi:hypothetical protein
MSLPPILPRWRLLTCILAVTLQAASTLSASEEPQHTAFRMPLVVPYCGVTTRELPALLITALDAGNWSKAVHAEVDHALAASWGGLWPADCQCDALFRAAPPLDPKLPSPLDNAPTYALVSGLGELRPRELTRDGSHFTLRCDGVEQAQPTLRGSERRQLYAVSLGVLPMGVYQCSLEITWRTQPPAGEADLPLARYAAGALDFTVISHLGTDVARPVTVLTDEQMAVPSSSGPFIATWQEPRCRSYHLIGDGLVGLWDATEINLAQLGAQPVTLPTRGVAQPQGTYSAVILGPWLNTGEQVSVNSVTVVNGVHQVLLETWTDSFPRSANVRHRELLVVPIRTAPGAPAHPPVVLVWRDLHATTQGEYREVIHMAHAGPIIGMPRIVIHSDPMPVPVPVAQAPPAADQPISSGAPTVPVPPPSSRGRLGF